MNLNCYCPWINIYVRPSKVLSFRIFVIVFLSISNLLPGECDVLPTYLWDTVNPLFNETQCGKPNRLHAQVNDILYFMCPSRAMSNVIMKDIRNYDMMYENIWFTSDREAATACNTGKAHHLFDCDRPEGLMYYGCQFRQRLGNNSFEPGKTYYFFGTGNGKMQGLKNRIGGHCATHNMHLTVYVCNYYETCNRTESYGCAQDPVIQWRYMKEPGFDARKGGNVVGSMSNALFSLLLIAMFVVGILVGVVLKQAWHRMRRKLGYEHGSSGLVSPAKSSYSDPEPGIKCALNGNSHILQNDADACKGLQL